MFFCLFSQISFPLQFLFDFIFIQSPYWLVRKKRIDAAERSLRVLLGRSADVTKELDAIRSTTTLKQSKVKNQVIGSYY